MHTSKIFLKLSHGDVNVDKPIMDGTKPAQISDVERHGSPTFYDLLAEMAAIHDKKSHDYASNDNPYGNYHFAGQLSKLFTNPDDSGFIGRLGEKLYRLANLENRHLAPNNESIEDTERDICVITALWISDRRDRRKSRTAP
jgi:hypothetical protein